MEQNFEFPNLEVNRPYLEILQDKGQNFPILSCVVLDSSCQHLFGRCARREGRRYSEEFPLLNITPLPKVADTRTNIFILGS